MTETFIIWVGLMSVWAFLMMGIDKSRAKKSASRIPEKTLWIAAIAGGGIGAYLGMLLFRHKTRNTSFRIGFLLLAIVYVTLILILLGVPLPSLNQSI